MTWAEVIVNGIMVGFGAAIGSYLGTKFTMVLIERQIEKLIKRMRKMKE